MPFDHLVTFHCFIIIYFFWMFIVARDMPAGFHMKILEELIPKSYIKLEEAVIYLRTNGVNIMKRSEFW